MKKQFTLILILVTSFFFNTYSQSLANTTWSVYQPNGSFLYYFRFTQDSLKYSTNNVSYITSSSYTVMNSNLSILDSPGGGCANYVGQYTFAVQSNTLSFSAVNDQCSGRLNTFTTCKWVGGITGVDEFSALNKIGVYPNPTTGLITISLEGEKTIQVLNYLGQLVKTFTSNAQTISLDDLTKGAYQLIVLDKDRQLVATRKIVLE